VLSSYGVKAIRANVPVETIINKLPSRKGEFIVDRACNHCVSNEKLKKVVPTFIIQYPLKIGVATTIKYYEQHNKIHGIDYEYDGQCDMLIKETGLFHPTFVRYDKNASKYKYWKGLNADTLFVKATNSNTRYKKIFVWKIEKVFWLIDGEYFK